MNLALYYLMSFTWGIFMNLVGFIVYIFLFPFSKKKYTYHGRFVLEIGRGWGGVTFGNFIMISVGDDEVLPHELGHSIQNAFLGPLFPFLVGIPSVVRYWYFDWVYRHDRVKYSTLDYYSAWFEADATKRGNRYIWKRETDCSDR